MRRQLDLLLRLIALVAVLTAVGASTVGCGSGAGRASGQAGSSANSSPTSAAGTTGMSTPKMSGDVVVFAAASLTDAFGAVGKALEAANPGTKITFSFGGSSGLVAQLQQGAPADVFASADEANMKKLTDAALVAAPPVDFATNKLQIVVPKGNPKHIAALADLARPGVIVALCAPSVPCGSFAAQALQQAGVALKPASLEDSVRGVLTKAQLGEIDAGIVYATDVLAGGDKVEGIAIPDAVNPIATYPIAVLKAAKNQAAAQAFQSYVRSPAGREILARYGFLTP